ncbi:hypothetical protein N9055_02545 [Akkermansiaceae bacterium]|nr:hypothetical protein [Akkermansiaceae bacterium]
MDKSSFFSKLPSMKLAPFPSPRALVRQWEKGEIKREELHALMAQHQEAILAEAEEERANPIAAYIDHFPSSGVFRASSRTPRVQHSLPFPDHP